MLIALGIVIIWLSGLSFYLLQSVRHYKKLIKNTNSSDLQKILEVILQKQDFNKKEIADLDKELKNLAKQTISHVQNLGLVKFNPFNDTGSSQSFSLALLDGNYTGLVMTGLHARERTRVYIKPVNRGKSSYELSNEEKKALEQALKK